MRKLLCMTTALTIIVGAACLDAARADDNPYTPEPAASTETPDHGQGAYCTVRPLGAIWSCEAPKLIGGEGPNKGFGGPAYANEPKPAKDDCDHGPKGEGGGGGGPDGQGRSSIRS